MIRPTIERGAVLIAKEDACWGDDMRRPAQPHEIVAALVLIIEDLREEIDQLRTWRENSR